MKSKITRIAKVICMLCVSLFFLHDCKGDKDVSIIDLWMSRSDATMFVGDTLSMSVVFYPKNVTDKSVSWFSNDPEIVSVQDGLITAESIGTAVITVVSRHDGDKFAICNVAVIVPPIRVESVNLSHTKEELKVGDNLTLKAIVEPSDASNLSVDWKSSNPSVAHIDDGVVTAVSVGEAVITVTTRDRGKTAICEITVVIPVEEPKEPFDPYRKMFPQVDCEAIRAANEGWRLTGDAIPDFSRVGYRWGDIEIPNVPVVRTLEPPADESNSLPLIQACIDELAALPESQRGAILLKKGIWNIGEPGSTAAATITIRANGIVLRGEGNEDNPATSTVLVAQRVRTMSRSDWDVMSTRYCLIEIGSRATRTGVVPTTMNIIDTYVPTGRFWVRVTNPGTFMVGDNVVVYRNANAQWISDIQMDRINLAGGTNWNASTYRFHFERVITKISGDTLVFENPIPMSIESKYGGGAVYKYSYASRPSEIGVENMMLKSVYNPNIWMYGVLADENHTPDAIDFFTSEHCWVKDVNAKHFGYGLAVIGENAKNISVINCRCTDPVSSGDGSRKYLFEIAGQLSLVKDCVGDGGRHSFSASPRNPGPNAFVNCYDARAFDDSGPHFRWNMATLYDNVRLGPNGGRNPEMNIRDRGGMSSHGWSGTNNIMWNCTAQGGSCVESPWVSGRNFNIGFTGRRIRNWAYGSDNYLGSNKFRILGFWYPIEPAVNGSVNSRVTPESLYDAQLKLRKQVQLGGIMDVK